MLVYEKKKKDDITLCFSSEDQKRQVMGQLNLKERQEQKKVTTILETLSKEDDDEDKTPSKQ
jgi:hypothetical protein